MFFRFHVISSKAILPTVIRKTVVWPAVIWQTRITRRNNEQYGFKMSLLLIVKPKTVSVVSGRGLEAFGRHLRQAVGSRERLGQHHAQVS